MAYFVKGANIINVPDMASTVMAKAPRGVSLNSANRYLTGERQFGAPGTASLGGAVGGTLRGAGQVGLSPILGLFSAGAKGQGRQSGLSGMVGSGVDTVGNLLTGNLRGAGQSFKQLGRDVNPWNPQGAWSKSIQRHAGKGTEDVSRQIPHWVRDPGGFWGAWGNQSRTNAKNYGGTAL